MTQPLGPGDTSEIAEEREGWDQVYRDCGYEWCRPCQEWHRPPECDIDETGKPYPWWQTNEDEGTP